MQYLQGEFNKANTTVYEEELPSDEADVSLCLPHAYFRALDSLALVNRGLKGTIERHIYVCMHVSVFVTCSFFCS